MSEFLIIVKNGLISLLLTLGLITPTIQETLEFVAKFDEIPPIEEVIPIIKAEKEEDCSNIACCCSKWARENGVDIPVAHAWELKASTTPQIGGGILFDYDHIGVIRVFVEEGFFIEEANKEPCKITTRIVSYNDPHIIGFPSKKL